MLKKKRTERENFRQIKRERKKDRGIVPFVTTPLKGRFVVFLKWLLIGYFWLGYIGLGNCPAGLGKWPRRVRNRRKATLKIRRIAH